uniref:Uncharacterized protein n=1 Tax=Trichogramma kaykai TaxID=54128 RepID=A0ABD2X0C6_9HYME
MCKPESTDEESDSYEELDRYMGVLACPEEQWDEPECDEIYKICGRTYGEPPPCSGMAQFRVRSKKLLEALLWLQENNIYYKHLKISYCNSNSLPDDGDIISILANANNESNDDLNENFNNSLEENSIFALPNINQQNRIETDLNSTYPTTNKSPINEFTSEGYMSCAFPTLFPTGQGDFLQPRLITVTALQYFRYLMMYKDGRFAQDPRFRYFAMNRILRHEAITQSNIYLKKIDLKNKTIHDLKEMINSNPSLLYNIMVYSSRLASSNGFWHKRYSELKSMIEQLGKPTIFSHNQLLTIIGLIYPGY